MILVSIIGIGKYLETTYQFEGKQADTSPYIIKAIKDIFRPDKIYVIMTEQAKTAHYENLKSICDFEPIPIQTGKNENELWEMFQSIVDIIPDKSNVIIDVTHGFRSQPMILLAISVYLQVTKKVTIDYILYGAYDAKDDAGISPIFNLKPFLDLISWSFSTEILNKNGDANLLSEQLTNIHNTAYKNKNIYLPKGLKSIGTKLLELTKSFSVVRPQEIVDTVKTLPDLISKTYTDIENLPSAKPFKKLLDEITVKYSKLIECNGEIFTEKGIKGQTEIIQYYLDTKQYQQAITLSRELLVTAICSIYNLDKMNNRNKAELILNSLVELSKEASNDFIEISSNAKKYADIWQTLGNCRNDINHAGMRKNPITANSLVQQIEVKCKELIDIVNDTAHNI